MASISTLGVGSGLDLSSILDQLQTAEKASLKPISDQQSSWTAKLSAYGTLKSAITAFQTANTALADGKLYSSTKAVTSGSGFTATSNSSAVAGNYNISVTQLAQAQTLTSGVVDSTSTSLGDSSASRTMTIQSATGKPVQITLTDKQTSLTGMRDAINSSGAGVTASIVKVADGSFRLSVTSNNTGSDNSVSISVSGDDKLQGFISYDPKSDSNGMSQSVAAQNAKLTVNNIPIESSSNTISDALQGITLNLTATTTSPQALTVTKDTSALKDAVTSWVNAYNSLQDTFGSLTKYTQVTAGTDQDTTNGALLGDSTLRTIQNQLKSALSGTSDGTMKTLAQLGITTDPTSGDLKIDDDKLTTALSSDTNGAKSLLLGDGKTTGVVTSLGNQMTSFLSSTGLVQTAINGVSKTLNQLTDQYNEQNARINDLIARYKTQFTQLDVMMNSLNSTSTYLSQQFDAMNGSSSKS